MRRHRLFLFDIVNYGRPRASSTSSWRSDRTPKFALAGLVERSNTQTASAFLDEVATVPYHIHTVLPDMVSSSPISRGTGMA